MIMITFRDESHKVVWDIVINDNFFFNYIFY